MVITGRSWAEKHVRTIFPELGFIKGFLCRFRCTHGFINLKTFVHMQNRAFVPTYTFRMKSTKIFINEAPGVSRAAQG